MPLLKGRWLSNSRNLLFFCFSIAFYLLNKIPVIFKNYAADADEAINIAEASILRFHDPVLWRSVDFFTIGPLHIASFIIPSIFGFPLDYTTVRVVWLFENLVSISFIYLTLNLLFKVTFKNYAFLISLLIFGFGNNLAFNHFNNESLSIMILSICIYLLFREIQAKSNSSDMLFYFFLGLSPFCKLQSVPIAFVLFVLMLILRLYFQNKSLIQTILKAVFFTLLPSLILFAYLIYFDQLEAFYYLYLKSNFNYENSDSLWGRFLNVFLVRTNSSLPVNYFLKHFYVLIFIGLTLFVAKNRIKDFKVFAIWLLSLSTIYAIIKPGFAYNHYFTYLILTFPLGISMVYEKLSKLFFDYRNFIKLPLIVTIIVVSFLNLNVYFKTNYILDFPLGFKKNKIVVSKISSYLIDKANELKLKPQIVVFDWKPQIFVETGFLSATHQNVPERLFGNQVLNQDILNYSRNLYLNDIKRNKPVFFIIQSSESKEYYDYSYQKLSTIKALKTYFDNNYIKINEIDSNEIFIRKDLFKSIIL